MEKTKIAIGIDLGGTRIKAIALDQSGQILHTLYEPTHDGAGMVWKGAVASVVQQIKAQLNIESARIGISAPGLPNATNTAIAFMPGRMQGLEDFDWSDFLETPTLVLNDAVAALVAEARLGAAQHYKHAILLTLGTGVGGAILINGQPYQGAYGKAGHLGHIVINDDEEPDITGMPGSLEDAIGDVTIGKRSGGRFDSTRALLEAYRNGDPLAVTVWLTSVRKLAIGLASLSNVLSPECVVLGGGIAEAGADLFDPLHRYLDQYEWRTGGNRMQVAKAKFGDLAGAVGAACFVL